MAKSRHTPRVVAELKTADEIQMYATLQSLAKLHRLTTRDVVISALREAVRRLQRRPVPHGA